MNADGEQDSEIIRMFPDYADTVLWFGGPVDYPDTGLSAALVQALQAWEQSFYDSLNRKQSFASRGLEEKFAREGIRLAKLVSSEIGSGHMIEYLGAGFLQEATIFRCPGTASNPAAAASFDALVEARRREAVELMELLKGGSGFAQAPLSGGVFDPQGVLGGKHRKRKRTS